MTSTTPRIIHRYWSGAKPAFVDSFHGQWVSSHDDWDVRTWTDKTLPSEFVEFAVGVRSRVDVADEPRHRANILRYWLLNNFGGVWVDADVRPLRRLDPLLDATPFTASLEGRAEGAVIGGPEGHAFFNDLVSTLARWHQTGSSVRVSGADFLDLVCQRHPDVRLLPASTFFTSDARGHRIYGDSYTEHLWYSSRLAVKGRAAK